MSKPRWTGGTRQAALQPSRNLLQRIELDELARAIEANHRPHPAEHGNIGNGIVVAHDPLSAVEARVDGHLEHAFGFVGETLQRTLVSSISLPPNL